MLRSNAATCISAKHEEDTDEFRRGVVRRDGRRVSVHSWDEARSVIADEELRIMAANERRRLRKRPPYAIVLKVRAIEDLDL